MAFLLFVSGCDKKPERMDDYLVEFATLLKEGSSIRFQLDNGQLLIPESNDKIKGEDRQRVILNYTPEDNRIKQTKCRPFYTGAIERDTPKVFQRPGKGSKCMGWWWLPQPDHRGRILRKAAHLNPASRP